MKNHWTSFYSGVQMAAKWCSIKKKKKNSYLSFLMDIPLEKAVSCENHLFKY